ncbi:MAG: SDR family oxidoreductase [Candidatus Cyclobacteriaceae bacterium M3_2C_046]
MKYQGFNRLTGQTAIVTGASSGIGMGVAYAMAKEGANVVVNYHSSEGPANELVEEIKSFGGNALPVQADVSDEKDVKELFNQTCQAFETVDILVANSGMQQDAPFLEMSYQEWQKVIDINLTGQFLCCREAAREFMKRGLVPERSSATGKIICMSSVHDKIPWKNRINYAASKGGIYMMMKTMAQELAEHKIRVNGIGPGAIKTRINQQAWETEEAREQLLQLIPYDRIGEPVDVAKAAVWLASDESDYVTGVMLYVDGGMILYPSFTSGG